jgi:hypothetical protein
MNRVSLFLMAAAALCAAGGAQAQPKPTGDTGAIFTCTNAKGQRLTSDRPIGECMDREQRVLNQDGSLRRIMPPSYTAEERTAIDEAEKKKAAEAAAKKDAIRRDRNLLARYPNEAAHERARDAALDDTQNAINASSRRLVELEAERKPLLDEAEFYKGKSLPLKLKRQIDANDVAVAAQRESVANQQAEVSRINALYDAERSHMKKLWDGAEPGSIGAPPSDPRSLSPAASAPKQAAASAPSAPKR